jgi:hypothetical protein
MPREELKDQEPQKTEEQTLELAKETLKDLDAKFDAEQVKGGAMHTSFTCGADLCTTH